MPRPLTYLVALGVLLLAAVPAFAAIEKPIAIEEPLIWDFSTDFSPKPLSKTKQTPVTFDFSTRIRTSDGSHPPALKEFRLEGDRHARVNVKGVPICKRGRLGVRPSFNEFRKACRPAIVGRGQMKVQVQFPEQAPISVEGELLVLNGGVEAGMTRLYLHTYLTAPVTGWIVTSIEIRKIRKGRYGLEAVASVPKIAGGAGSIASLHLTLEKGIVSATCADGRLQTRGAAVFADGTHRGGTVIRTCTPREKVRAER